MDLEKLSIDELKDGYIYDQDRKIYQCNACGEEFNEGEVYTFKERFFEAFRAIEIHINGKHSGVVENLLHTESKYNSFTQNQKEILKRINMGLSDKEIAKEMEVSPSTIRHHRFTFREKAKQAKMQVAILDLIFDKNQAQDSLISIHSSATMVDDRYLITEKEKEKIKERFFESIQPLKLKTFSAKEKNKVVILGTIAETLKNKQLSYSEEEINAYLQSVYNDYAVLRRYLVDYGFMERTTDGTKYWMK